MRKFEFRSYLGEHTSTTFMGTKMFTLAEEGDQPILHKIHSVRKDTLDSVVISACCTRVLLS